ncbi:hypothetical protein CEXT_243691 [Caerostris extrusa]|uniref:Uncharacterized protein n=1 Tax=Caerostris extrusa TaxID=172846 RepID=A0AAV4RVU5_CAEEX|nr:hypothetical protein CEXT_243691 [Caerostris extrusa]
MAASGLVELAEAAALEMPLNHKIPRVQLVNLKGYFQNPFEKNGVRNGSDITKCLSNSTAAIVRVPKPSRISLIPMFKCCFHPFWPFTLSFRAISSENACWASVSLSLLVHICFGGIASIQRKSFLPPRFPPSFNGISEFNLL